MTLGDIIKRVKDRSHRGDVDVTTDNITSQMIRAVNDGRREIITMIPKEWLLASSSFDTADGTAVYSLDSDVQEPLVFRYTKDSSEYILYKIHDLRDFWEKHYSASQVNQQPRYFVEEERDGSGYRQIRLWPVPDDTYTVDYNYYKDPTATDLTTADLNTEIPDIPGHLQDVLWKAALYYFLWGFDDPAKVQAKNDYLEALGKAINHDKEDLDGDIRFTFDIGKPPLGKPRFGSSEV